MEMNRKVMDLALFIFGAAAGSALTWFLVKDHYEQKADEEIASVKEVFSKRKEEKEKIKEIASAISRTDVNIIRKEITEMAAEASNKPSIMEFKSTLHENGYSEQEDMKKPVTEDDYVDIHLISELEFGDDEEFDTISLTYYMDGVITDEDDEILEDVESRIGENISDYFGDGDAVYIRNDTLRTYYEVLRDYRTYEDAVSGKPRRVEIKK